MSAADLTMPRSVRVLLTDLDIDVVEITRRAGLPDRALDGEPRLPVEQYHALWEALERQLGTSAPVVLAETITGDNFDPEIFAALCCPHLEAATAVIARWKQSTGHAVSGAVTDGTLVVRVDTPGAAEAPPGLVTTELLFWVALARLGTRTRICPVGLTTPTGSVGEAVAAYAGTEAVTVGSPSISFALSDARSSFLTANREMLSKLAPGPSVLDERTTSWGERVRLALVELLPAGNGSLDATAARLTVSPRTLHRRLSEEGTSYRRVLDATRRELAELYLEQPTTSWFEASMLLGYQHPRSFRRAVRAWRRDERDVTEGSHP